MYIRHGNYGLSESYGNRSDYTFTISIHNKSFEVQLSDGSGIHTETNYTTHLFDGDTGEYVELYFKVS